MEYKPTMDASALSDTISEVSNDITKQIIRCEHDEMGNHAGLQCEANCPTVFRITEQELQFYKQMNLLLPIKCFNCRHVERISWRNSPQLYKRECMCDKPSHGHDRRCQNEFETSYAPERPEIVYCESCYHQEVA